jgi:hypothetical protein
VKFVTFVASAVIVVASSGCGQAAPAGTTSPPTNVSNDAIVNAVLTYKACPTEADTLQVMAAKILAQHHATIRGTGVFRRYGDQAQVAIAYDEQGSQAEATFTYTLSSRKVAGSNAIGQEIVKALLAECG